MAIRPAQNVVTLFGICSDALDGKLRIVMELCTHGSLRDYVKSLPASEVCDMSCIVILLLCVCTWMCVQHVAELSCRRLVLAISGVSRLRPAYSCSWRVASGTCTHAVCCTVT